MDMTPTEIRLRKGSRCLRVSFTDDVVFNLPFEYLRVYSPSAEVKGHGPGQEVLQTGKEDVVISNIEAVGHYAVRLIFDDGHDSGLFTWQYLHQLGSEQEERWASYLDRLTAAGYPRRSAKDG